MTNFNRFEPSTRERHPARFNKPNPILPMTRSRLEVLASKTYSHGDGPEQVALAKESSAFRVRFWRSRWDCKRAKCKQERA